MGFLLSGRYRAPEVIPPFIDRNRRAGRVDDGRMESPPAGGACCSGAAHWAARWTRRSESGNQAFTYEATTGSITETDHNGPDGDAEPATNNDPGNDMGRPGGS